MAQKIGMIAYNLARELLVKDKGGIAVLPQNKEILGKVNDIFQMLKTGGYNAISAEKNIKNTKDLKRVLTDIEMKQQMEFDLRKKSSEGLEKILDKMDRGIPLNPSDQKAVEGAGFKGTLDAFKGFEPKVIQGGKSEGIRKLIKDGDVTIGTAPKTTKTKPPVDPELQAMDDQNQMFEDFSARNLTGIDAMKEANLLIGRKGKYKNISEGDAKTKLNELQEIINKANAEPDFAEGGRIGFNKGGIFKFLSENSPIQAYKKYLESVKRRSIEGDFKSLAPELGAVSGGGILVNRKMKSILKEGNELQKEKFLKEFIEELNNDPSYKDRPELKDKLIENYTESLFGKKRAMGGRIGFKEGSGMSRRTFLKLMGGLASIPFVGKLFKPAAKVAKTAEIAQQSGVPAYFPKLVEKIKMLGDDVTRTNAVSERQVVTKYKDYEMTENLSTGNIEIEKTNEGMGTFVDMSGEVQTYDGIASKELISYSPPETVIGKNNKPVEVPAIYEETTARSTGIDGKLEDFSEGLDSYEEILEEVGESKIKKAGGGLAYMLGE